MKYSNAEQLEYLKQELAGNDELAVKVLVKIFERQMDMVGDIFRV